MTESATAASPPRYDDLRAMVINCTLKRSPERSHTQGLIDRSTAIPPQADADSTDRTRAGRQPT
jgi:hypothetical protein